MKKEKEEFKIIEILLVAHGGGNLWSRKYTLNDGEKCTGVE